MCYESQGAGKEQSLSALIVPIADVSNNKEPRTVMYVMFNKEGGNLRKQVQTLTHIIKEKERYLYGQQRS